MDYTVNQQAFEGPLDLLLSLIEKAELDIEDIFISEITSQYLAIVGEMDACDMDSVSEFMTVAAQLILIKSRRLLPKPQPLQEGEIDPETELIERLREYQKLKLESMELTQLYLENAKSVVRKPEEHIKIDNVYTDDISPEQLSAAFFEVLNRVKDEDSAPVARRVRQDAFTVRSCAKKIRDMLKAKPRLAFTELFSDNYSREELTATFLALLELLKHGEIRATQSRPFAPIMIRAKELNENDDYTYIDEAD